VSADPHSDHGHGHGSPFIQHHYDDAQHQFDSGKLGIWLFLAQEVLFFSALFVAYILYRYHHPEIYAYAHKYLDVKFGAINTAVLIFSSLTAAWAVRAAQLGQRKLLIGCLAATLLCACAFLGIKYIEYSHKYHEQILMGKYFDPCVSSGGAPLLTKSNECPGSQGSVWWDNNAAQTGCYPVAAIDVEPRTAGIQVDCKVAEVVHKPKRKDDGSIDIDEHGRWVFETGASTPIANQCAPHGSDGASFPCWQVAPQPAVCRPGFFYTITCEPGAACEKQGRPRVEYSRRFNNSEDCNGVLAKLNGALKEQADTATMRGQPAPGVTLSACYRSESVGFVVAHGDHDKRAKDLLATASCALPPPQPADGDVFAEVEQAPRIGQAQIVRADEIPQDDKHALYMGPPPENTNMFFTIYFAMTGLHGIHVLVGILVFIWLLIRAVKGHFTPDYFGPIDFAALYWHIVDLIWIFLFPLLYLIH
jgi:heme/copper-type cytochrome/quinol oxidase subunit 3